MVVVRTFFKQGPKAKKRQKPIARKSKFKEYGNVFKKYRLEPTENIKRKAEACRAAQIDKENPAELAWKQRLSESGIEFAYQVIYYRTGSYIVADFITKGRVVCFEIDGGAHDGSSGYDQGRDAWLLKTHRIPTFRIPARDAFSPVKAMVHIRKAIG